MQTASYWSETAFWFLQVLLKDELTWRHSRLASAGSVGLADLRREIAVMRTLRHRNIVSLREVTTVDGAICSRSGASSANE